MVTGIGSYRYRRRCLESLPNMDKIYSACAVFKTATKRRRLRTRPQSDRSRRSFPPLPIPWLYPVPSLVRLSPSLAPPQRCPAKSNASCYTRKSSDARSRRMSFPMPMTVGRIALSQRPQAKPVWRRGYHLGKKYAGPFITEI